MKLILPNDWNLALKELTETIPYKDLEEFIVGEYQSKVCYPPFNQLFKALEYCSLKELKVVLLGQDPYHGAHQATGMSFSVPLGVKHPPSLVNIFRELESDQDTSYPISGALDSWAEQGVLLLNAALSVVESSPGSHLKEWSFFTDAIIEHISETREGVVFMLWGGFAHKKEKLIDTEKHCVLKSGHPSPLSANKGHWFGNKHFSKANVYLKSMGAEPIDWRL
jgi:uracil-DNA glycosylase